MKTVSQMLIFDVDGVITNPSEKRVTEPEILDEILKRLEKGEPVALNTGRSLAWLIDRVVNPMFKKIKDKKSLRNFFAVGEKGGTWLTIDENGKITQRIDETITIPDSLRNQIRTLIKDKYSKSMFYDESKMGTMISTEMDDAFSIEEYSKQQNALINDMENILNANNLGKQLKIDPTTIAVDIENKYVGKGFAVKRIIEWAKKKGISPQRYIAFGDSLSDLPMAQELNSQDLPVEFVYVGNGNIDTSNFPFPVHRTQAKFGKGTLEFLKTL